MKWLIGITGVILIGFVIFSSAMTPSAGEPGNAVSNAAASQDEVVFRAKENNGRIAIFAGEKLLYETQTRVSELPKSDRTRLKDGITLFSDKELKRFIEDYCS